MWCDKTKELKRKFAEEMLVKLLINKPNNVEATDLFNTIEDVLTYFEGEKVDKFETN